jgi:hypothetical protein
MRNRCGSLTKRFDLPPQKGFKVLVNVVHSIGRCNTNPKPAYLDCNSQKSFSACDANETPSWIGSYRLQQVINVLHREAPSDQLKSGHPSVSSSGIIPAAPS